MKRFQKIITLFLSSALLSACGGARNNSANDKQSSNDVTSFSSASIGESKTSSNSSGSSSEHVEQSSLSSETMVSSSISISSSKEASSLTSNETSLNSSIESSSSELSSEGSSSSGNYSSSQSELSSNPTTCEDHYLEESIIREATIIQKGIKRKTCPNCGGFTEEYYYDLKEFDFSDTAYSYDGHERELLINGLLPYGTTVKYENNKLTDIGSQVATARIYDENNNLLTSRNATISIVENIGLPNIRINTQTSEDPNYKEKEEYTPITSFVVDNCLDKYSLNLNNPGGIRVRGNSTNQSSVPKRAWRVKFENKRNLLGLNNNLKAKSWVLMADFFDSSMFRNATAWSIGNDLFNYNSYYYCTDRKHVNVYMNGDYRGIYLLAEQQQANTGRIPINEAEKDYTGTDVGYLLEIDGLISTGQSDEEYTFSTGSSSSSGWGGWGGWGQSGNSENSVNGVNVTDKSYAIKTDVYGDEQLPFIKKYVTNVLKIFKQACKGEKLQILDENNELIDSPYATQYETLNAVMDIDSFFRMYVLQEFVKNYDVGWGSFYLYVDFSSNAKVKRLTLSAPWDFDLGSGNKQSGNGIKTNDDYLNGGYANSMTEFNPWLYLLSQTDFFKEMFDKYYSIFANSCIYEKMVNYINYETSAFSVAFNDTYTRWDLPNAINSGMSTRRYKTHQEAVDYLTSWYSNRKTYLDNKYLK